MALDDVVFAREARALGADRELSRRFGRGEFVRLVPGAYVPSARWRSLDDDARYRLKVATVSSLDAALQISHASAAAIWRIESLGPWPRTVHARAPRSAGGRSTAFITRHTLGMDADGVEVDGIPVTSLHRTALDLAAKQHFTGAVVQLDAILNGRRREPQVLVTSEALEARIDTDQELFAPRRTARALDFADARSQSVGESVSRVQFHALGAPPPQLQVTFGDEDGHIGEVDFFWPEFGVVGEFDGKVKYSADRMHQRDIPVHEVLVREKWREDRIRRQVREFMRWDWATAMDRRRMAALLVAHGIPLRMR